MRAGRGLRQRLQAARNAAHVFESAAIHVMRIRHQIDIDGGFAFIPRRHPVGTQLDRIETYRQYQVGFTHVRHVYLVDHRA